MGLILINDFHLVATNPECRLDHLPDTQFDKLNFINEYAREHNCSVLCAGDLLDSPRSWYLLPKLTKTLSDSGIDWYVVYGQHDTYQYSDRHRDATSLGVMINSGVVKILSDTPSVIENFAVYGANHKDIVPDPWDLNKINVLCVHESIALEPIYWDHQFVDAKEYLESHPKYTIIHCGDIHRNFTYQCDSGRMIVNSGPILRIEADEYTIAHKPCFFHVESGGAGWNIDVVEIPHQPAELVMTRGHIVRSKKRESLLKEFIELVDSGANFEVNFLENLRSQYSNIGEDISSVIEHYIGEATKEK